MEIQNSTKWHELAKSAIHSSFLTEAEAKLLRDLDDLERIQVKEYPLRLCAALPPDNPCELEEANKDELYKRWGSVRTVRPSFLAWFLNDKRVQRSIRHNTIFISNCLISSTNFNTLADSYADLDLSYATLPFALKFDHCVFPEKISLNHVTMRELTFEHCWLFEFDGRNMVVEGDIRITGCRMSARFPNKIDLWRSQIGGSIKYDNSAGSGIICDESTIRLDLELQDLQLHWDKFGGLISAQRADIYGNVTLSGLEGVGEIRMDATTIHRDLKLYGIKFDEAAFSNGFRAPRLTVEGIFSWNSCPRNQKTKLWIPNGHAHEVHGDNSMQVGRGNLNLDGFEYVHLGGLFGAELDKWLVNQFLWKRQPYEQYARWWRGIAPSKATEVLITAEEHSRRRFQGYNRWYKRFWRWVLRATTGYGYRPLRSLAWMIAFVILGTVVFNWGHTIGALLPVGGKTPLPVFNAFIYSLDVFLPIIDFQQAAYWVPEGNGVNGQLVQFYTWLHIALGWVFTTLAVAGFTGLLKSKGE